MVLLMSATSALMAATLASKAATSTAREFPPNEAILYLTSCASSSRAAKSKGRATGSLSSNLSLNSCYKSYPLAYTSACNSSKLLSDRAALAAAISL